jgi:hypothetical protein
LSNRPSRIPLAGLAALVFALVFVLAGWSAAFAAPPAAAHPAPASSAPPSASASATATPTPESPDTAQAREEFVRGTDFVHKEQWAEALSSFERSAKLRSHAVTTYNIGTCQRALGRYTLARKTFRRALDDNTAAGGSQLPNDVVEEIKAEIAQLDGLLASADVKLDPPGASIAVDGRPLDSDPKDPSVLVAGLRDPGPGAPPPVAAFKLMLDPGAHVITLSRKGYADAFVNQTFRAGSTTPLPLVLDRLPATLHIGADQEGAVVVVNGTDVGVAPVDVSRPAGSYRVVVSKPGFVNYEAQVVAQAGEQVELRAKLPVEKKSLTQRWWFWTAAGVLVLGAAGSITYFATRPPPPERPPLNCGGLGWCVQAQ